MSCPPPAFAVVDSPPPSTVSLATSVEPNNPNNNILGLRQQIIVNAGVLFPQLVVRSASFEVVGSTNPFEIFEVVIIAIRDGSGAKQALLLHGSALGHRIIAAGAAMLDGDEPALRALLSVTSVALGWYMETLFGEIEHAEPCTTGDGSAGGTINHQMVQDGYNFVHYQRYVQREREQQAQNGVGGFHPGGIP